MNKLYKVTKIDSKSGKEFDYGTMNEEDMKATTKGYTFNGLFYDREGSKYFYTVEEI